MSTRMPGIVELDAEGRIAGDQPPRPFVAAERQQLRVELGSEADRMAALAAMLRVDHRMVVEQAGDRDQRRRLHQRHVARQDEPAGGMRPGADPGADRMPHADAGRAVVADLGQDDHVAGGDALPREVGERARW